MRCRKAGTRAAVVLLAAAALIAAVPVQAQSAFEQGLDAYLEGDYQTALEHWRPAAETGDMVAAFNIGVLYAQGLGVQADPVEAVRWYRRSAHAGYPNAQFNLGAAYYNGEGTEVNVSQAISWWERAADQDHPEALYNLATLYRRGAAVPQDTRRAVSLFREAAALGDSRARQALVELGAPVAAVEGGGSETGRAAEVVDDAPDPADPARAPAAAGPGRALADENPEHWTVQVFAGTEEQAAKRFALEQGLADELRIYRVDIDGRTWFKGIYGSFPDREAAGAAQADLVRELPGSDPWARSFRAIQAESIGEVSLVDMDPAVDSPSPAPQSASTDSAPGADPPAPPTGAEPARDDAPADPPAEPDSGDSEPVAASFPSSESPARDDQDALRKGQQAFNAEDYETALAAWRPLAEKGVAEAQYGVGFMYESGWGVDRDHGEAFHWYQQAAQQGHAKAQYNLGMLYRNGQGVSQNDALGLYWIQSAADRGNERAADFLKNPGQ